MDVFFFIVRSHFETRQNYKTLENLLHISIALKVVVIVVKAKLVVFLVEDVFNVKTSHTNTYVQQPQTGSSQAMQLSPLTIIIYEKTLRY